MENKYLQLKSIIGFDGNCPKSLRLHPDKKHIIYPFGIKLAAQNLETKEQFFFEGHSNVISTVAVSQSGKYIASGQINFMGFKAPVIVWDWEKRSILMQHDSHKVRVESVMFSSCENFIISLGGRDDANVIVFNIFTRDPICGVFSSNRNAGDAVILGSMHLRGICFITGGVCTLKVWTLNPKARSVRGVDVAMGKIKRKFTCVEIDKEDKYAYCGTSTGDIVKVKLNFSDDLSNCDPVSPPTLIGCYGKYAKVRKDGLVPRKPILYSMGVRQLVLTGTKQIIVGTGDGTIEILEEKEPILMNSKEKLGNPTVPLFSVKKSTNVGGFITSLQLLQTKKFCSLIVGTRLCEILIIDLVTFNINIMVTCHTSTIFDLAFPRDYSEVFATASKDTVRLWSVGLARELLRISVPNFTCSTILFTYDGKCILTAWNDGTIRAFTPQSGKLIFTINDAHNKGVSALAISKDGKKIVSGGTEGQIRIWNILKDRQMLTAVLKEHKGPVSSIDIAPNDKEAASASTDGTCIIWDLEKCVRISILFSSTLFTCVRYHPTGVQILTTGTNRQIAYWEVFDGSLIREVEGSTSSALNTLDIAEDGVHFVTGANDQFVKVWKYQEGTVSQIGQGHGAVVTAVKISPDMSTIVTCSADGAILIWQSPFADSIKKKCQRRSSVKQKDEKIVNIDEQQSVGIGTGGGGGGDAPSPTVSVNDKAARSEGGSIKCYCTGGCTCKSEDLPKTPVPPPTAASQYEEDGLRAQEAE